MTLAIPQSLPVITLTQSTADQQKQAHGKIVITKHDLTPNSHWQRLLNGKDSIIVSNSGSGPTIAMRGFGDNAGDNIKLSYNGIDLSSISMSGNDLNLIDPALLNTLIISPFSDGVVAGNNAVAGSLSLNQTTNNDKETRISLSQSAPQATRFSISNNFSLSPWTHIQLGAFANDSNPQRCGEKNQITQLQLLAKHHDDQNTTQFFFQTGPEKSYFPGGLTRTQVNADRFQRGSYYGSMNNYHVLSSLRTEQQLNNHISLTLKLTEQQSRGTGMWADTPLNTEFTYTQNADSQTLEPSLIWNTPNNKLTIGTYFQQADFFNTTQGGTTLSNATQYQSNAFINNTWHITPTFSIDGGFRVVSARQSDKANSNGNNTEQFGVNQVGIDWQLTPAVDWQVRRAGAYRLPLVDENAFTTPNTQLNAQRSTSYETVLSLTQPTWRSSLTLYDMLIRNEIAYAPPLGINTPATNTNLPKTRRQGMILNSQWQVIPSWSLSESVALMKNHFRDTQKDIPWTSPITASAQSEYKLNDKWSWQFSTQYIGKRYAISDYNNALGAYGQYALFNTALNYHYQHWRAGFAIDNLTNRHYYTYVVAGYQNALSYYPAPGITARLSVSYVG